MDKSFTYLRAVFVRKHIPAFISYPYIICLKFVVCTEATLRLYLKKKIHQSYCFEEEGAVFQLLAPISNAHENYRKKRSTEHFEDV